MKFKRLLFLVFMLGGLLLYNSCRKVETLLQEQPHSVSTVADKFFNSHRSADIKEKVLVDFMKRKNDKELFIGKTVSQIGYPRWDKTLSFKKPDTKKNGRGNSEDSISIYYVPFVRDSQNFVNASLIIKAQPADTTFYYICDWQYQNRIHGSPTIDTTAERYAVFFMILDNRTFGYTEFNITDTDLFPAAIPIAGDGKKLGFVNFSSPQAGRNSLMEYHEICVDFYVCGDPGWCAAHGGCDYLNCQEPDPDQPGHCYLVTAVCDGWWEETGGGGGGGTGGGTGGTGGSGGGGSGSGGSTPPDCNSPVQPFAGRSNFVDPCTGGWEPIPIEDEPGGGGSTPPEPIDSMLARYSRAIKPRTDSLLTKSLLHNWEHSMIIVKNGDSIYLKNEKTSQDSLSTEVDFTLSANEVLLGYIHCHSSASSNINDRSAPSGSDVKYLRERIVTNFVQMTECGNTGYALVIEDPQKAKTFLDSLTRYDLDEQLRDSALIVSGWFSNWQNATQIALVNLLGSAASHGIGFYKSTDALRENWIKLN